MFTLSSSSKTLAETRDFAHTQATGLINPNLSAEQFTRRLQKNAQEAYERARDKVLEGQWPLPLPELENAHEKLCEGLQKVGGQMDLAEATKYNESCDILRQDIGAAKTAQERLHPLAAHVARCEEMRIFRDHNSAVHRLALESHMDMFLGPSNRAAVNQSNYVDAVKQAQNGDLKPLADLIEKNHQQGVKTTVYDPPQKLKSDYEISQEMRY